MRNLYTALLTAIYSLSLVSCMVPESSGEQVASRECQELITHSLVQKLNQIDVSGPALSVKRLSREEIASKLKLDIKDYKGANRAVYEVGSCGFTPGQHYQFYQLNAFLNPVFPLDCVADDQGELILSQRGAPLREALFETNVSVKGEPFYFAALSQDEKTCAIAFVAPDSIEYAWKDGARAATHFTTAAARTFFVSGTGFQPNEKLTLLSESGQETLTQSLEAKADGTWVFLYAPATVGKTGGQFTLSVKRAPSQETGVLKSFWGDAIR